VNTDGSPEKRLFYHGAHGVHRELIKKNSVLFVISVVSFFSGLTDEKTFYNRSTLVNSCPFSLKMEDSKIQNESTD
jgi:hypothetical protein